MSLHSKLLELFRKLIVETFELGDGIIEAIAAKPRPRIEKSKNNFDILI